MKKQQVHVDSAELALAQEFSDYLANVSREIIDPISKNVQKHQQDVDRLIESIMHSRITLETSFTSHEQRLDCTEQKVVSDLARLSDEMKITVQSITEGHEETRQRLLGLFGELRTEQQMQVDSLFARMHKDCVSMTTEQTAVMSKSLPQVIIDYLANHLQSILNTINDKYKDAVENTEKRYHETEVSMKFIKNLICLSIGINIFVIILLLFKK